MAFVSVQPSWGRSEFRRASPAAWKTKKAYRDMIQYGTKGERLLSYQRWQADHVQLPDGAMGGSSVTYTELFSGSCSFFCRSTPAKGFLCLVGVTGQAGTPTMSQIPIKYSGSPKKAMFLGKFEHLYRGIFASYHRALFHCMSHWQLTEQSDPAQRQGISEYFV